MMSPPIILFFTNSELGQASVILAVAAEIARTPGARVHLASFSPLAQAIPDGVDFHCLPGLSMKQVLARSGVDFLPRHRPGVIGTAKGFAEAYARVLAPWDEADYFPIFDACRQLIKDLDPSLVVLDPLFGPGHDASEYLARRMLVLSPNTFKDHATASQPGLDSLFQLPCLGSGYAAPLGPLTALCNIYLLLALHINSHWSAPVQRLAAARRRHGGLSARLSTIANFDDIRADLVFLVPSTPASDFPLRVVPPNLLGCGPILAPAPPLAATHPELAAWLTAAGRATVVINMGSHVTHAAQQAGQILRAVTACLRRHAHLQVLWKLQGGGTGDAPAIVVPTALLPRLRIVPRLPSTPAAILTAAVAAAAAPSSVCAYVYHGGSNSFHEAVAAGVPHVVCPVWLDTYDFATRVEHLGIGVWATRGCAPAVEAASLEAALEEVIGGEGAEARRRKARWLAQSVGGVDAGRKFAAERVLDAATRA